MKFEQLDAKLIPITQPKQGVIVFDTVLQEVTKITEVIDENHVTITYNYGRKTSELKLMAIRGNEFESIIK